MHMARGKLINNVSCVGKRGVSEESYNELDCVIIA